MNKMSTLNQSDMPVLEISGEMLRRCLDALISGCEEQGGVERYVRALQLKTELFKEAFETTSDAILDFEEFKGLCTFMPTVRRRVAPYLDSVDDFARVQKAVQALMQDIGNTTTTDSRIAAFMAAFPDDKSHRWVRDLAAELLHNTNPELYPMMTRWVWDQVSNSGVIREIWFGEDVDGTKIEVPDQYATFITLRKELSEYLSSNGVFRDMPNYVDLLMAKVYSSYIAVQGGSYLRADFGKPEDPMLHTRRLLGLDGVGATGKTRLKAIDGQAFYLTDTKFVD